MKTVNQETETVNRNCHSISSSSLYLSLCVAAFCMGAWSRKKRGSRLGNALFRRKTSRLRTKGSWLSPVLAVLLVACWHAEQPGVRDTSPAVGARNVFDSAQIGSEVQQQPSDHPVSRSGRHNRLPSKSNPLHCTFERNEVRKNCKTPGKAKMCEHPRARERTAHSWFACSIMSRFLEIIHSLEL